MLPGTFDRMLRNQLQPGFGTAVFKQRLEGNTHRAFVPGVKGGKLFKAGVILQNGFLIRLEWKIEHRAGFRVQGSGFGNTQGFDWVWI